MPVSYVTLDDKEVLWCHVWKAVWTWRFDSEGFGGSGLPANLQESDMAQWQLWKLDLPRSVRHRILLIGNGFFTAWSPGSGRGCLGDKWEFRFTAMVCVMHIAYMPVLDFATDCSSWLRKAFDCWIILQSWWCCHACLPEENYKYWKTKTNN